MRPARPERGLDIPCLGFNSCKHGSIQQLASDRPQALYSAAAVDDRTRSDAGITAQVFRQLVEPIPFIDKRILLIIGIDFSKSASHGHHVGLAGFADAVV
jgi:hypothetical protein